MSKDSLYFSHDFGARNDPKLQEIRMTLGCEGLGIYWCIVEMLYEQGGFLPLSAVSGIAYDLHEDIGKIRKVIEDYGLFEVSEDRFCSITALERIEKKKAVSEARRAAGQIGAAVTNGRKTAAAQADGSDVRKHIASKMSPEDKAVCRSYDGDISDIEDFYRVFHFDRNCKAPAHEVARFIRHYQPNGWCRKGSAIPVASRTDLARSWDFEDKTPHFTGSKALEYLSRVYEAAMNAGIQDRWTLFENITDARVDVNEDGSLKFIFVMNSRRPAAIIDAANIQTAGVKIYYRMPNEQR